MKNRSATIYKATAVCLCLALLGGCAQTASSVVMKSTEMSAEEFKEWYGLFKSRLEKMDDNMIGPFIKYLVTLIGEDKARMPREGERLIDQITAFVNSKGEKYVYTKMDRAFLLGAWDRLFIIINEEMGKAGYALMKKLLTAGVL